MNVNGHPNECNVPYDCKALELFIKFTIIVDADTK